jgi:hypothetical protein
MVFINYSKTPFTVVLKGNGFVILENHRWRKFKVDLESLKLNLNLRNIKWWSTAKANSCSKLQTGQTEKQFTIVFKVEINYIKKWVIIQFC